jgi:cell wall-associated NlpC family hydrolase
MWGFGGGRASGVHGGTDNLGSIVADFNRQLEQSLSTLNKMVDAVGKLKDGAKGATAAIHVPGSGTTGQAKAGGVMAGHQGQMPEVPGPATGQQGKMVDPGNVSFGFLSNKMMVGLGLARVGGLAALGAGATAWAALPETADAVAMQGMLHQMGTRQNVYLGKPTQTNLLNTIMGSIDQYAVGGRDQPMMAAATFSGMGIQNQGMLRTLLSQNQGLALMTGLPNSSVAAAQAGFSNGPMAARMLSFGMPTADIGTGNMKGTQQILETMYQRMAVRGKMPTPEGVQESYYRGALGSNFRTLGLTDEQQQIALQYFTERARSNGPVNLSDIKGLQKLGYNENNAAWMSEASKARSQLELMNKTFDSMAEGSKKANKFLKGMYDWMSNLPADELKKVAEAKGMLDTAFSDPAFATGAGVVTGLLGSIKDLVVGLMGLKALKTVMGGGVKTPGTKTPVTDLGVKAGKPSPWSPGVKPKPLTVKPKAGGGVLGTIAATVAATIGVQFLPDWMTGGDDPIASGSADLSKLSDQQLRDMGYSPQEIALIHSGGNDESYTFAMDKLASKMENLIGRSSAFGHSVGHRCLQNVQDAWQAIGGTNKARWGTAATAAAAMKKNSGPAPRGALLLWNSSVGSGAGHIAVSDGRGNAVNNWGGNVIEKTPISQMKKGYLGWAYPHEGLGKNPSDVKRGWLQGVGPEGSKVGGATGQAIAEYAQKFVGTKYRAGGRSPKTGWDCAGFTWYVAKHFGITLATTAGGQLKNGSPVPLKGVRAGDLIIYAKKNTRAMNNDGHVAISLGGGRVIHAGRSGTRITSVQGAAPGMQVVGVRRIAGGGMGTGAALTSAIGFSSAETGSPGGYVNVEVSSAGMSVSTQTIAETVGGATGGTGVSLSSAGMIGSSTLADGNDIGLGATVGGKSNRAKVWNMLMNEGFSTGAAAGVIGNLMQESGVNPNSNQHGGGPGRGIMQWTVNERWASLKSWAKKRGLHARDLDTQVQFMLKEMKDYGVLGKMRGMNDVEKATLYFENTMERAGVPNMSSRYKFAREALKQFGRGSYSGGAYQIGQDEDARVHTGEMIIPADKAAEVRHAMAGVMSGGKGGGHTFNIYVPAGTTEEQANIIARRVASILDRKTATKNLMEA